MSTLRLLLDHAAGWLLLRVDTGQQDLDDVTFVCFCVCVCVCVCVVCVCVCVGVVLCCVDVFVQQKLPHGSGYLVYGIFLQNELYFFLHVVYTQFT